MLPAFAIAARVGSSALGDYAITSGMAGGFFGAIYFKQKTNSADLAQSLLDYSNMLNKISGVMLMGALKEWTNAGYLDNSKVVDTNTNIQGNPINNNNFDPNKADLTKLIGSLVPALFFASPNKIDESSGQLPLEIPIRPSETVEDDLSTPVTQKQLNEVLEPLVTSVKQAVQNEANGLINEMNQALNSAQSGYNYCVSYSSSIGLKYVSDGCLTSNYQPFVNDYNRARDKANALNNAYKGALADLIRSMLRNCLTPEYIWDSLGSAGQDLFVSKAEYMESANWEREQMANAEPCCLKKMCCFGQ